jgi:hypothetical protein
MAESRFHRRAVGFVCHVLRVRNELLEGGHDLATSKPIRRREHLSAIGLAPPRETACKGAS